MSAANAVVLTMAAAAAQMRSLTRTIASTFLRRARAREAPSLSRTKLGSKCLSGS